MSKTTNEILDKHVHWGPSGEFDEYSEDEFEDPESQVPVKTEAPANILKAVEFGERKMAFFPEEVKKIRITRKSGIELLGFKPINRDLIHHIKATKFIGVDPAGTTAEKELFAALLKKCEEKQVMAICVVGHKAGPYLANLTPCSSYNGFYVNKIAYAEQVNFLLAYTEPYIYVGGENGDLPSPTDKEGVALMRKIVRKLRINWDPYMFKNPKLNAQLQYIETLTLDAVATKVPDTTLPPRDIIVKQLGDLTEQFKRMFANSDCRVLADNEPAQSQSGADKAKRLKFDAAAIRAMYDSQTLQNNSYVNLKAMAQSLRIPATGKKDEILQRLQEYCRKH